ncbi:MAG: TlpA family protein disulfide reductase [Myxococcota bacterium]
MKSGWLGQAFTVLLVVGLLLGAIYQGVQEAKEKRLLSTGELAPDFGLRRPDGSQVTLSSLRGQVVMLDFWATWCPPCVREMPYLTRLAKEYEARGLAFVAANNDEPDEAEGAVEAFVSSRAPELRRYVAFSDEVTSQRYRVRTLPTVYVIDRQGRVAKAHAGLASETMLRRWIEEALR